LQERPSRSTGRSAKERPADVAANRESLLTATALDQRLQQQRDEIRRELLEHGYRVLPDGDLPLTHEEMVLRVSKALDESDLAIHLIGGSYGLVPEGSEISGLEIQEQLSAARTGGGKFLRILYAQGLRDLGYASAVPQPDREDPVSQRNTEFLRSSPTSSTR
jgi:hypothetical protein